MNAATEFDVGPLTWVKSEIDLALERANQALQQYTESLAAGAADPTQLKFCRTHLHQVQGALTIVGLDGVTQFAEAVEAMLEAIEQQSKPGDEVSTALAQRALAVIGHYLNDLVSGQPNQPLRLLSIYREVQAARGVEHVSATDLFFPDLSARPPRRESPTKSIPHSDFQRLVRQERARFQRGLLAWLRSPQDRSGVSEMLGAVKRIEATQEASSARSFWWIATGFLSALAEGTLPEETNVKQLCARIDLQIRRLFEGSKNVAERLMRDALYFVANADSNNNTVRLVKTTYQLQDVIPSTETVAPAPEEAVRRKLHDVITATEEAWNKYCAGTMQSLPLFKENANALSGVVEQLGQTDFRRLAQAIATAANWLSDDHTRHSEIFSMEVATAILLTQNAQENLQHLGSDFAHQVDVTVARIHACLAGTPPQPGSEIPLLDEMSRQAQEKLLIGQVAKEIQSNFAQIEQVLDGFFRDAERRADLTSLEVPFRQVAGALTMMRHDAAAAAVRQCSAEITRFSDPAYDVRESDFEFVANQLSLIGFFIDSLQHGAVDFESFSKQMQSGTPDQARDADEVVDEDSSDSGSVEHDVDQQKKESHPSPDAPKEQPDALEPREDVKLNLESLEQNSGLGADPSLGEQNSDMLSALDLGEFAPPHVDETIAQLKPPSPEMFKPSAETIQLAQASTEEVDAELLGIFLEEANEVLGTIDETLKALVSQPHNVELLTTIRRSFHTLKGSGRMVGLKDVGEAAWAIEQTLNQWLRQELEVSAPIFDLIGQAHAVFSVWVQHLESNSGKAPDPTSLTAFAESLRRSVDEPPPEPTTSKPFETNELPSDGGAAAVEDLAQATDSNFVTQDKDILPPQDEVAQTAEIITLDFPSTSAEEDEDFFAVEPDTDASATETADFAFGGQLEESTKSDAPVAPAIVAFAPREDAREPVAPEAPVQPKISVSPTLYEIFSEEAGTHLATLKRELHVLESEEFAPTPHAMCRAAHTLGGISATVGIKSVNQLGLALEHALMRRDGSEQVCDPESLKVIRQAIETIELSLVALAGQREPEISPELLEALEVLYPAHATHHESLPEPMSSTISEELPDATVALEAVKPDLNQTAGFETEVPRLRDEIDDQLLPIFLEEAVELNEGIATQLRAWRSAPENQEAVRILTRLLHTLKGSARMAGAMNLGEITHAIETRVEQANRTGSAPLDVIDEIDNAFDDVLQIIERLQRGESLDQPTDVPAETVVAEPEVVPQANQEEPTAEQPAVPFVEHRADRLRTALAEAESDLTAPHATLRVRADLIDRLVNEAGELSIARARIEGEMRGLKGSLLDLTENVIRLRRQLREIEIQSESQMQSRLAQPDEHHAEFDPLEFDRFTRFQELTRMMAESVNDVSTVQQNLLKNLDDANAAIIAQARLNREVQQKLMAVRMVPLGSLADRLYRVVRQTSKELNKRVNLEIKGSQVELDRGVLDKIGAPLEHMLRNAVVHGIEDREVRSALGKPDIGEISLLLKQEGNEIILSLSDDGAGLDFERIRERAVEAGLLAVDEEVSSSRLADLIFTAGFTTASEVSQVAGRGVGMDVVKTEVSSLGGRIEIVSNANQGTQFNLYIPLTLAVTKALLVRADTASYAIPSAMIEQVLDLKEAELTRIRDAGAVEWMNNRYPFSYLPHLLGETQALPEQHRRYWVLLLRSGTRRIAVQVDELMGNQEIVVKNIGPQLARVVGVDGATVLGNGQVVLILNPVALSSRTPVAEFITPIPTAPVQVEGDAVAATLPTVMVVDDSLTVRKITGRLLAREGYQVILAKDGVEALEHLLDVIPDVMIVDIEMPRMDGFDLTRNIRADDHLKAIPIIMITSRTADKHRNFAFEIGVNHYLGKPYQEDELLELVAGYVTEQRGA